MISVVGSRLVLQASRGPTTSSSAASQRPLPWPFPRPVLQVVLRRAEPRRSGGHADAGPPGRGLPDPEAGGYRLLRHHLQVSPWAGATSHSAEAPGKGRWEKKGGTADGHWTQGPLSRVSFTMETVTVITRAKAGCANTVCFQHCQPLVCVPESNVFYIDRLIFPQLCGVSVTHTPAFRRRKLRHRAMERPAENLQPVSGGAGACTPATLATQMGGDAALVSSQPPLPLPASGEAVWTSRLRAVVLGVNSTPRHLCPPIATKSSVREGQTPFIKLSLHLPICRVSLHVLGGGSRTLGSKG